MELTGEQLKMAETQLKSYLPQSKQVYSCLVIKNILQTDAAKVLVDAWPKFSVIIYKPQFEQKDDPFIVIFATDGAILAETIRKPSTIDWTSFLCVGITTRHMEILESVAVEKNVPITRIGVCHMLVMEDLSKLVSIDSSGISLGSLDESHADLINEKWKFGNSTGTVRMIRNMIANFPSCCVLDAERKPVSWVLIYPSGAMGMLYTLPEHRGKGYAKIVALTLARTLYAQGYPVFGFIVEDNIVSYNFAKSLGFTVVPSYRETWLGFNN